MILTILIGFLGAVLFGLAVRDHASAWADMILGRSTSRFWRGSFLASLVCGPAYAILPGPLQAMFTIAMPVSLMAMAALTSVVSVIAGSVIQIIWIHTDVRRGRSVITAPDPAGDLARAVMRGIVEGVTTFIGIVSVIERMGRVRIAYAYARARK